MTPKLTELPPMTDQAVVPYLGRLRESHTDLLAAAKRVVREHGAPDTICGIKALCAAITRAEQV